MIQITNHKELVFIIFILLKHNNNIQINIYILTIEKLAKNYINKNKPPYILYNKICN